MINAPFYGVPGLFAESFDHAARELNEKMLEGAWRYPSAHRDDLEPLLAQLFGPSASIERAGSALRVKTEKLPADRLTTIAERLAKLDTRVRFVKAEESVEVLVFFDNPHGYGARARPIVIGRALTDASDCKAASAAICPCGAKHIAFVSRKAYGGQEADDVPIACLRCGRSTLLVLDVPGGAEVHLADELPPARIGWLPARSESGPSRADYPSALPAAARPWLRSAGCLALMFGLAALVLVTSAGRGPRYTSSSNADRASRESSAGSNCNQRECVLAQLNEIRASAVDAGAPSIAAGYHAVERALESGDCDGALRLARQIEDFDGAGFSGTKLAVSRLSLDVALMSHCEFLKGGAATGDGGRRTGAAE